MVDFIDILTHRSSYRGRYDSIPVPREDLRKILEAGLAAPSTISICCDSCTQKFIRPSAQQRLQ